MMERTKSAIVSATTLGLGCSVVAAQVGLYMGAATTNLILDGVIATKNTGSALVSRGYGYKQSVESQLISIIASIQGYAKVFTLSLFTLLI